MGKPKSRLKFWLIVIIIIVIIIFAYIYSSKTTKEFQESQDSFLQEGTYSENIINQEIINRMSRCLSGEKIPFPGYTNLDWCDYTPNIPELTHLENIKGTVVGYCINYGQGGPHSLYKIITRHPQECIDFIDKSTIIWDKGFESSPSSSTNLPTKTRYRIINYKDNYYFIHLTSPSPVYIIYKINIKDSTLEKLQDNN